MRTLALVLLWLPGHLLAHEPKGPQVEPNPITFTIRLIHLNAGAPLPDDLPDVARPSLWRPGYEMTFLMAGSHLARIKQDSLVLDVLRNPEGRDLRQVAGQPAYRQGRFPRVTADGKYGLFSIESETASTVPFDGIQLRGSLVVTTAEGRETLRTRPLQLAQKQKLTLGEFTVGIGYGLGPSPLDGVARGFRQVFGQGSGQPDPPTLSITVEGNLAKLAGIAVIVGGKKLRWRCSSRDGETAAAHEFDKEAEGPGVIELSVWKDIKDVRVPFRHNIKEVD